MGSKIPPRWDKDEYLDV